MINSHDEALKDASSLFHTLLQHQHEHLSNMLLSSLCFPNNLILTVTTFKYRDAQ